MKRLRVEMPGSLLPLACLVAASPWANADNAAHPALPTVQGRAYGDGAIRLAPAVPREAGGFRMEGSAEIAVVFGDSRRYKAHIDRFYDIHDQMAQARRAFGGAVHEGLAILAANSSRTCPSESLAHPWAAAHRQGERYKQLGVEFEEEYHAITRLHEFGESAGLTPDYRWKVNRTDQLYEGALLDYREMRVAFVDQLGAELRHRGCNHDKLLALGSNPRAAAPVAEANRNQGTRRGPAVASLAAAQQVGLQRQEAERQQSAPPAAAAVTFVVDNTRCPEGADVYLDGTHRGLVPAGQKTAFQTVAGRHALCLLPASSTAVCGQRSTLRSAFIHDAWSIAIHCSPRARDR